MGLLDVVFVVLLILKLAALISISWWVVFSPLILSAIIGAVSWLFIRGVI